MTLRWVEVGPDGISAISAELVSLYAEVYSEPPYCEGPDEVADFVRRLAADVAEPGFALVACWRESRLVGYVYGYAVAPGSALHQDVVAAGRPAAAVAYVSELLVRADARRDGVGRRLHDRFLADRPEQTAVLFVHPRATAALAAYRAWGWQKIGLGVPFPGAGDYDLMAWPAPR